MGDDEDARTIHIGNLYADKITEDLLYELFLQVFIFPHFQFNVYDLSMEIFHSKNNFYKMYSIKMS